MPEGVRVLDLNRRADSRGSLLEVYRSGWDHGDGIAQWNVQRSRPGTLRGVQVHQHRRDYFTLVEGRAVMGLHDLRAGSATEGASSRVELTGDHPQAVVIPSGVAHGWWFLEDSLHLIGFSTEWDDKDEHHIQWDDPALGVAWPSGTPLLSPADRGGAPLEVIRSRLADRPA